MFSKFSVKKPMTVIVAVLLVIILGVISFTSITTDMLPSMDLPYVAVITTYPGASPEKVEQAVTKPLEQTLSTTGGVEAVTSVSSENMSMVILQFTQGTNMDSAMIEMSGSVDRVKAMLDDAVGTPTLMKINPDMLPVMVASVDIDGKTAYETSRVVQDTVIPALERVEGVASVTATGLVEEKLQITLNQEKIDALNKKILASIDESLAEKQAELEQAAAQLAEGRKQAEDGLKQAASAVEQAQQGLETLRQQQEALAQKKAADLANPLLTAEQKAQLEAAYTAQEKQLADGLTTAQEGLQKAQTMKEELESTLQELTQQEAQLQEGQKQFEAAREEAYKQADMGAVITEAMISQILAAENFSMPAGSLTDGGRSYAVKVGEAFSSVEELSGLELMKLEAADKGVVKLSDVADIEMADNAEEMYAKINGNDGILLSLQKQSNASTAAVSHALQKAMDKLTEEGDGLHILALSDQGTYIDIVINSVLQNLLMGGALAVLILLLFLRDVKPTAIIAVSIPVSLLFAVAMMYFSGVTMNVISLAGLALGVGMLVDNSIVVIENIYRLRAQGVPAAAAAVKGASQVAGAITASTLTTICVFLPIVFTEGISRQLFTDMGLTIAYSLIASLIIAMTLVPTLASRTLRKAVDKPHKFFDRFTAGYGKALGWSLRHRALVLAAAVALLAVSAVGAVSMGTAFMPSMDSSQIMVSMEMPKDSTDEEIRQMSDEVIGRLLEIEDVETVGAMQGGGMMASGGGVSMYVLLKDTRAHTSDEVAGLIADKTADLPCEVTAQGSSMDISAMGGSGLEVTIKGEDMDRLQAIAKDVAEMMKGVEGTSEIADGLEDTAPEIRVTVDKNKAMGYGLTVAQVYQQVAAALQTETTATTLTVENKEYPVIVLKGEEALLTRETLGDLAFTVTVDGAEREVKLSDIAAVTQEQGLSSIRHENQLRTLTVSAAIDQDYNIGLVSRELEKQLNGYSVPEGYSLEISGENETINSTLTELLKMVGLAIVFIYLIMVAQFQSLKSPFIVMFTIPLAFTGGLLALWITGMEISVISMLGFLVLAGVVVNNGIVFVDYVNQLRLEGMEKTEALVLAGRTRIRPILMTALTTILGLFTLALGIGEGADMLQPMAVVTIGGLTYATLLTLFVVPALYSLFHRKPMKKIELEDEGRADV